MATNETDAPETGIAIVGMGLRVPGARTAREYWKNLVEGVESVRAQTDEQLLVLPLAHIFARHLVWGAVENGAVTAVGEGEPQIAANLLEVAPTFMGAVPRMYEMAHARVMREVIGRSPAAVPEHAPASCI